MKRFAALLLTCALILTSCFSQTKADHSSVKPPIMDMTEAAGLFEAAAEVTAAVRTVTEPSDESTEDSSEEPSKGSAEGSPEESPEKSPGESQETAKESNVRELKEMPPADTGLVFAEKTLEDRQKEVTNLGFTSLDDPDLLRYVEDDIYAQLVAQFDSTDYFVENIEAVYISKEYLDELEYNSLENIFFGYTLSELEEQFVGTKFVFTLGEDGQTIVQELEEYDDTFGRVIKNVAIGTGVILICVTVSVVSGGAGAPAVSMIFAASAKSATIFALSSGAISGVSAGVVEGMETKDFDQAIKAAAVAGSEEYKWGAFSGAITGGVNEAVALKGATLNGLTMNEAATIQKETKYPLDVIKEFRTMDQYMICKDAGLSAEMVSGKTALIRNVDLDFVDDAGLTNLQRMCMGKPALDPTGVAYELHHVGQKADSTLAILTRAEHRLGDNHKIWHIFDKASEVHMKGNSWNAQKAAFWKDVAALLQ